MIDHRFYCLRFRTRAQAMRVLFRLGFLTGRHDDGRVIDRVAGDWVALNPDGSTATVAIGKINFSPADLYTCIDEIGPLTHPDPAGTLDADGNPVQLVSAGWHINLAYNGRLRKKLRPFVVKPNHPKREFCGRGGDQRRHYDDVDDAEMLGMDATDAQIDAIVED